MRGFIVWATQQEKSATSPYTPHRVGIFKIKFISMATAKTPKKKQVVTKTYVTDIRCENCVNKIKKNVDKLGKGVKDVQVNLEKKEVNVTYDASKTNDANIIKGFSDMKAKKCDGQNGTSECKEKAGECKEKGDCCKKNGGHCKKAEAKQA